MFKGQIIQVKGKIYKVSSLGQGSAGAGFEVAIRDENDNLHRIANSGEFQFQDIDIEFPQVGQRKAQKLYEQIIDRIQFTSKRFWAKQPRQAKTNPTVLAERKKQYDAIRQQFDEGLRQLREAYPDQYIPIWQDFDVDCE